MPADDKRLHNAQGLWATLLLSIYAWAPATHPGYWQSLEGFAPIFNARYPNPIARIAALPDLWQGTGSAAFIAPRPLVLLGMDPTVAVRSVFALTFLAGGLGIYAWLRPLFGDRGAGLGAALYVLMPPFLTTVYVRGSLGDAHILAMLPIALAGLSLYVRNRSPAAIGAAVIAILWMWRTQAGLAVFASLLLLLYALLVERDLLGSTGVMVSAGAGLLSLAPVWQMRAPTPVAFDQHFLALHRLLGSSAVPDISLPDPQQVAPFALGYAGLLLPLLAAWLLLRRAGDRSSSPDRQVEPLPLPSLGPTPGRRLLVFALGAVVVATLLSLSLSSPLWRWTRGERLLTYPWQIFLPVLPCLAGLTGGLPHLEPALARRSHWTVLLLLMLLGSFPFLSPRYTDYTPPDAPVATFGADQAIVLLEAEIKEQTEGGAGNARLDLVWQVLRPLPFDYNLFLQALHAPDAEADPTVVDQLDRQPLADLPATRWQPGQIFTATYQLPLSLDPTGANLRYYVGFYDWRDGSRLPIDGGIDDKVVLYGQ